jgi:hypothetical protein
MTSKLHQAGHHTWKSKFVKRCIPNRHDSESEKVSGLSSIKKARDVIAIGHINALGLVHSIEQERGQSRITANDSYFGLVGRRRTLQK